MTGIILLICCILVGFCLGRYFQKQVLNQSQLLEDICRYLSALQLNVTGKQCELANFNRQFDCSTVFRQFLQEGKLPRLSKQRKQCIESCFANLDCDCTQQLLQHLQYYGEQFHAEAQVARLQSQKASVYTKLGMLLGAMAGILFL